VRILFLARHFTYFRNFESVLEALAASGHAVHLAVERQNAALDGSQLAESMAARFSNVTCGEAPVRPAEDDWAWTATQLRLGLDYLRYLHPIFDTASTLRARARERTPGVFVRTCDAASSTLLRRAVGAAARGVERAVPEDPAIRTYLQEKRPDVLLITPLVDLGSSQIDYLRAARALRIPTAVCVWSWDHLSSKALIRECPDRLFVWNDTQKNEAVTLHAVPSDRVVVTGAQCFDRWFISEPSRDRETFCESLGLPSEKPLVMYACSALISGSPVEAALVARWISALRSSRHERLRTAGVLVRPHPSRLKEWENVDLSGLGPVAVWGDNPLTERSRADYFDSLYHSAAVVGLNTSVFIEAAIVSRRVYSVLLPEYQDNQTGTVHFDYLTKVGGGLVHVGRGLDEHLEQLNAGLTASTACPHTSFVRAFVRPHGVDVPATPIFTRQVESLAALRADEHRAPVLLPVWRYLAGLARRARSAPRLEALAYSAREAESRRQLRLARDEKARSVADRKHAEHVRSTDQHRDREMRRAAKAAAREARLAGKRIS
jgi:hypothetical protein